MFKRLIAFILLFSYLTVSAATVTKNTSPDDCVNACERTFYAMCMAVHQNPNYCNNIIAFGAVKQACKNICNKPNNKA